MIQDQTQDQEAETPKRVTTGKAVSSYVVIGCSIVFVMLPIALGGGSGGQRRRGHPDGQG
jgi:hypothetical protein